MPNQTPTIYFAYGSNLSLHQMSLRCPSSVYIGPARLPNYRWIINARGYANIVSSPSHPSSSPSSSGKVEGEEEGDEVWGLTYTLTSPDDETSLDRNEGVPYAYTKEYMDIQLFPSPPSPSPLSPNLSVSTPSSGGAGAGEGEMREMLVYIDRLRVLPAKPRLEYIQRMNRGVRDAVARGVPRGYVERVVRKFIPEEEGGEGAGDGEVGALAERQARGFEEEEEEEEG
ncbi:hypothetical protein Q9189_007873 [Teloschistes chrysophthalmus]